jgi:hypothetical protein
MTLADRVRDAQKIRGWHWCGMRTRMDVVDADRHALS